MDLHLRPLGLAGARKGITEVPRGSFGAGTYGPLTGPVLLSCWVCRPKSIAFIHPVASLVGFPLPICEILLNPVCRALAIGRMTVRAINAASNAWFSAKPMVPPAMLAAMCGTAMVTIASTISKTLRKSACR